MAVWSFQYEANAVPGSAGMTREVQTAPGPSTESASGGLFRMTQSISGGATRYKVSTTSPTNLTVVVRCKYHSAPPNPETFMIAGSSSEGTNGLRIDDGHVALSGEAGVSVDMTSLHTLRMTYTKVGDNYTRRLYIDETDTVQSSNVGYVLAAGLDLGYFRISSFSTDVSVDYFYLAENAYAPSELPVTPSLTDLCSVPKRINTILSGRAAWGFVTAGEGSAPTARATADAWRIQYIEGRRPQVVAWIDSAIVKRAGPGLWRHIIRLKVLALLRDYKETDLPRLGALVEDARAALNDGNPALNDLTDVHRSRFIDARLLQNATTYHLDALEVEYEVVLGRRYTDTAGTFASGATNPRTVARALITRMTADSDNRFDGYTFHETEPPQTTSWPAVFVVPSGHPAKEHILDEHQEYRLALVMEDRDFKQVRPCLPYKFVADLEDWLHDETTLNGETGVRDVSLTGYRQMFGAGEGGYPYRRMVADVRIDVDK